MKNQNRDEESDKKKTIIRIIIMVIIIILLLLLITSCTSNFWGRIGKMFTSEGHVIIDGTEDLNKEVILNKDLKFDVENLNISLSDKDAKIKFNFKNINPKKFTCSTSDASIATCYVKGAHIIINPKKTGKVTVFIEADVNGKIYKASASVNVKEPTKGIELATTRGTINIAKNKIINIYYNLVGISGKISVSSSNSEVATAKASNGVLMITAHKTGSAKITLTVEDNGVTYTKTYSVNVINDPAAGGNNSSMDGNAGNNPNPSNPGTEPTDPSNPGEPTNPSDPSNPSNPSEPTNPDKPSNPLSNNKFLSSLTTDHGVLTPTFSAGTTNYVINVVDIDSLSLSASLADSKASIVYNYKGEINRGNLENLSLEEGANIATIIVTAENGEVNTYTITINKTTSTINPPSTNNKLTSLKINGKEYLVGNTTSYAIDMDFDATFLKIEPTLEDAKSSMVATISYQTSDGLWHTETINDLANIDYSKVPDKAFITIEVIAESGDKLPYTITVNRKEPVHNYTIDLPSVIEIDLAKFKSEFNLPYTIKDNGVVVSDIPKVSYDLLDTVKIDNATGKITIDVIKEDVEKDITLTYEGVSATAKIVFTTKNFYLSSQTTTALIAVDKNGNSVNPDLDEVILDTNIFNNTETIGVKNIAGGIRLYDKIDESIYADITTTNEAVKVSAEEQKGTKNPVIKVRAKNVSFTNDELTITGNVYNKPFNPIKVALEFVTKYKVIIYANGGVFSDLEPTKLFYDYLLASTDTLDLSTFKPYKLDDTNNCIYYDLASFNTSSDNTGVTYPLNAILNGSDPLYAVTNDLEIYAIYDETDGKKMDTKDKFVYITELNLFNDKANVQHKKDNIIYPGAEGAYLLDVENKFYDKMIITGMELTEETVCVSSGCLNMGYIIKHPISDTEFVYYHSTPNGFNDSEYQLLHPGTSSLNNPTFTKEITFDNPITLNKGEKSQFSFLWKWLDYDDAVDTEIGKRALNVEEKYILSLKLNYKVENTSCSIGG